MTFRNTRFPTGIRYGATATPHFNTSVVRTLAGKTQRNKNWTYPLRKFNVERALSTDALRDALLDFFYNMNGAADTFRIKDFTDFEVSATQGVFTSLGSGTYQMWKRYTSGSFTKDIPVLLPVSGTISVNGGSLVENTHYTLDYTTPSGVLNTIGSPPVTPSTWSGQYDIHARFESDDMPITKDDIGYYIANQITIIEERSTA